MQFLLEKQTFPSSSKTCFVQKVIKATLICTVWSNPFYKLIQSVNNLQQKTNRKNHIHKHSLVCCTLSASSFILSKGIRSNTEKPGETDRKKFEQRCAVAMAIVGHWASCLACLLLCFLFSFPSSAWLFGLWGKFLETPFIFSFWVFLIWFVSSESVGVFHSSVDS